MRFGTGNGEQSANRKTRILHFETLENRELLAVTAGAESTADTAAEISEGTLPAVPVILTGEKGNLVSGGLNTHRITWSASADAVQYELGYSCDGRNWNTLVTSDTSAAVTDLILGDLVSYKVRAIKEAGYSEWSPVKSFLVCPTDIDGDGFIGPGDMSYISQAWFTMEGDANWNPACDLDGDGFVGPGDNSFLSANWFKTVDEITVHSLTLTFDGTDLKLETNPYSDTYGLWGGDVVSWKTAESTEYSSGVAIRRDSNSFTVASFAKPGTYTIWVKVDRAEVGTPWIRSITFTIPEDYSDDGVPAPSPVANPAQVEITGDWQIRVTWKDQTQNFRLSLQEAVTVTNERYASLPVFNNSAGLWTNGQILTRLTAMECSVENELVPGSVQVRLTIGGEPLTEGVDYRVDLTNSTIGRIEGGRIGANTQVYVSYSYMPIRIDSVVVDASGKMKLVTGTPHVANPQLPVLRSGETRIANIFLSGRLNRLTEETLYPILDDGTLRIPYYAAAKRLLPKVWEKLNNGETVTILAWGDSVTAGVYLSESQRWQTQFVQRLRERFPNADIRLITEAWGGKTTSDYLNAGPETGHNYQQKVLNLQPDLIISEFVNDAGLTTSQIAKNYARIRDDFASIGAEWIICTPHYIRQDWMGLTSQKNIDNDPRPYIAAIRSFAETNHIALGETSILYGRLWRQGIPYQTLMLNDVNHPSAFGVSLYADALMGLFGKE